MECNFFLLVGDCMYCIFRNKTDMYIKDINNCDVFEHFVKEERKMAKMQLVLFFLELKYE